MLKELITQRNALDAQIQAVRSKEGKSEIKRLIAFYGLTPAYIAQLAVRLKKRKAKK